ncbi:MAG: hypothetical protein ABI548_17975 [Polyangiaceae bacterium]
MVPASVAFVAGFVTGPATGGAGSMLWVMCTGARRAAAASGLPAHPNALHASSTAAGIAARVSTFVPTFYT